MGAKVFLLTLLLVCWPYASLSVSIGPIDCPAKEVTLTPEEFVTAGKQGALVDNVTYLLLDAGEYQLQGEVNASNFSSNGTTCFIGSDSSATIITAAAGKEHFNLQKVSNIRLGLKSLTLLGDRQSLTGGSSFRKSLVAMEDVTIRKCGVYGVLLSGPPTGGGISGHFTNVTFTGNTKALELAYATDTGITATEFYGTTQFMGNTGGFGLAGPGMSLTNANATFFGPAVFKNNYADPDSGSDASRFGAAIFAMLGSRITFKAPVRFTGNQAAAAGAVLLNGGNIFIAEDSASFNNNTAVVNNGGAIILGHADAVIVQGNCSFTNNVASALGGAIYTLPKATIAFVGPVVLRNNQAGGAGGIMLNGSTMISNSTFKAIGNAATDSAAAAAALQEDFLPGVQSNGVAGTIMGEFRAKVEFMASGASKVSMQLSSASARAAAAKMSTASVTERSSFPLQTDEAVLGSGGALLLSRRSVATFFDAASFTNNTAKSAGAILLFSSNLVFNGPVAFRGNEAERGGAVLAGFLSTITANDTMLFENNCATRADGGAVSIRIGGFWFCEKQVTFRGNSAASVGGAVYVADGALLQSKALVEAIGNSADQGAGFFLRNSGNISAPILHLIKNNASKNGGGLVSDVGGELGTTVKVGDLLVSHNTAANGGGGVVVGGELLVSGDAKFSGNDGGKFGGAAVVFGNMTLNKACFIGNKASTGAAITAAGQINFNTSNGLQNFHHNVGLNGEEVSTIYLLNSQSANSSNHGTIICDTGSIRSAGAESNSSKDFFVEGPLCDSTSCPATANNCTCPGGTSFLVEPCTCGPELRTFGKSSAKVQVAPKAPPASVAVDRKVTAMDASGVSVGDTYKPVHTPGN